MTELDHKTFDLAAVLAGRDYPEEVISVYFDEKLGHTITTVRNAALEAQRRGDDALAAELQADLDELQSKVKSAEYKVHLRGVPENLKTAARVEVQKAHPQERDLWGRPLDNLEADMLYTRKLWALMIVKVEAPDGAISLMDEGLAQKMLDEAPKKAQEQITTAVTSLSDDAAAGFEDAAKQAPFLLTA